MATAVDRRDGEIERLQLIIKKLPRAQFGRRSERLDADQLALALENLDGVRVSQAATRPPHYREKKRNRIASRASHGSGLRQTSQHIP
jgi:transposase